MALKHIGRVKANQRKVVVAYRVVPGEPEQCLIVQTENLSADDHDSLMKAVESSSGQEAYEFGEAMNRTTLPDGRNMLTGFHTTGKMRKFPTNLIEMQPDRQTKIMLDELNRIIAEQKGVTINDLALKGPDGETTASETPSSDPVAAYTTDPVVEASPEVTPDILTDDLLAKQYRSQADRLSKEAAELRRQAEDLVPTKKKAAPKKTAASA
jgi:hypothetical protein